MKLNEDTHELTKDNDIIKTLKVLIKDGTKKLHLFVDHEIVEPISVEVLPPLLLLPQFIGEMEINDDDIRNTQVANEEG
jgi:hypothetical protein